jgi:FKBP-type peptidyl-prolyl cis-trans isomerase 2
MTRVRTLPLQAPLLLLLWCCKTDAFQSSLFKEQIRASAVASQLPTLTQLYAKDPASLSEDPGSKGLTRVSFLQTSLLGLVTAAATVAPIAAFAADDDTTDTATVATAVTPKQEGVSVYQLPSGLKYLELQSGTGPSPRYGQLCSIQYTSYIKLPSSSNDPNPTPVKFDSSDAYLIKHGNGRQVAGLDEGLHTMKVGSRRRILVPPKLGYVDLGLGPIPEYPWDRWRLNNMLDRMIEMQGGTVVFEVKLLSVIDDEADQGYYEDKGLSAEEFEVLQTNLQQKTAGARPAIKVKEVE